MIKAHRKKESAKVMDTCSLADRILDKIKDHEESVSPQLLDEYYTIRMLEMELEELVEKTIACFLAFSWERIHLLQQKKAHLLVGMFSSCHSSFSRIPFLFYRHIKHKLNKGC